MAPTLHEGKLWIPYILLLLISIGFLLWYPLQVFQAIWRFSLSKGEFVGSNGQSQIFVFSIVGAIVSVVLMTYWILKQERNKLEYFPIAVAVAYVCTISITMWYEQVYANLWDFANHTMYWYNFYTNPPKLLQVMVDMSLLFVAYPWMRRENIRWIISFATLTALFFLLWYATGFGFPTTSPAAYLLNGASRISSQLGVAVSVAPKRPDSLRRQLAKQESIPKHNN